MFEIRRLLGLAVHGDGVLSIPPLRKGRSREAGENC
jgi:hypothetical protein